MFLVSDLFLVYGLIFLYLQSKSEIIKGKRKDLSSCDNVHPLKGSETSRHQDRRNRIPK
jgi:hypothetical protein